MVLSKKGELAYSNTIHTILLELPLKLFQLTVKLLKKLLYLTAN
jgi:hypothetical protein